MLSTSMDDDADLTPDRLRRKRRRLIIAAVVVVVGVGGYWSTTTLPKYAVARAKQSTLDCVNAIYDSGEGDPADCRPSGAGFWLARTLPWTRDSARQEHAEIEALVLEHQLEVASVRDFDVELRDRAARELVALHRGEHPPQEPLSGPFVRLDEAGAHELMVELASAEDSTLARNRALRRALLLGQWDAAGSIARTSAAADLSFDLGFAYNAAIVACILGDRETATARLQEAEHELETTVLQSLTGGLIALHCDLPSSDKPAPSDMAVTVARMAVAQTEPIVLGERLHEDDLLERIGTHEGEGLAPVLARTRDERPGAQVIVADVEAGARRLAELAATAPSEHTFEFDGRTIRPRERLIWGAFCLASMATAERVWRGQLDEARAIYQLTRELSATEEFRTFGLGAELPVLGHHALFDLDEALRVARSVPADQLATTEPSLQAMFRIQLAVVYEQAGELERAIELTTGAVELLPQLPAHDITVTGIEAGTRWIHGSMLLRAGREASLHVKPPSELRGDFPSQEQIFAYWWTAALADPTAQVGQRWRTSGESKLWLGVEPWVLPYALELLARSAPAEHRDFWLDSVSADIGLVDPLTMIRGRATAAERLGDTAAVERWRAREAALLERLRDDRAAALYRMLDL
jgi:tetratricopeptide (TPR) repeat protein